MTDIRDFVSDLYVRESRRVYASLVRLLGDFDAAEEAMHEAFRAALEQWPRDGVPAVTDVAALLELGLEPLDAGAGLIEHFREERRPDPG